MKQDSWPAGFGRLAHKLSGSVCVWMPGLLLAHSTVLFLKPLPHLREHCQIERTRQRWPLIVKCFKVCLSLFNITKIFQSKDFNEPIMHRNHFSMSTIKSLFVLYFLNNSFEIVQQFPLYSLWSYAHILWDSPNPKILESVPRHTRKWWRWWWWGEWRTSPCHRVPERM